MQTLQTNWVTEGRIDFEYKKYILLAYLQDASKHFQEQKIYPFLSDLVSHYRNLAELKANTQMLENNFSKTLSKLDFENFTLQYEKMMQDDIYMEEIQNIIDYALPRINKHISIAREIYDEVEHHISISSVGIIPIYTEAGYLLFRSGGEKKTAAYQYELSIFENNSEKYRGLKTQFLNCYPDTIYNHAEAIKSDLIKKNRQFPNPATYVLNCNKNYPFNETIFPVARRRFVQYLQNANT
ncbi:MAG: hypothetical protein ACKVPJ_14360 [Chitinophagales bacterium]